MTLLSFIFFSAISLISLLIVINLNINLSPPTATESIYQAILEMKHRRLNLVHSKLLNVTEIHIMFEVYRQIPEPGERSFAIKIQPIVVL